MTERKEIPAIAKSAMALAQQDFQQIVNTLGGQALEAMGLDPSEGWVVDFTQGVAFREVPDSPQLKLEETA